MAIIVSFQLGRDGCNPGGGDGIGATATGMPVRLQNEFDSIIRSGA
jgi:hypothetical protein